MKGNQPVQYTVDQLFRRDIKIRRSLKTGGLRKKGVHNPLVWKLIIIDHVDVPGENYTQKQLALPVQWFRTYEEAVNAIAIFFQREANTRTARRQLIT